MVTSEMACGLVQRSRRLGGHSSRKTVEPGVGLVIQKPGRGTFSVLSTTMATRRNILAWSGLEAPKVS